LLQEPEISYYNCRDFVGKPEVSGSLKKKEKKRGHFEDRSGRIILKLIL
jgi:hypothetical protein